MNIYVTKGGSARAVYYVDKTAFVLTMDRKPGASDQALANAIARKAWAALAKRAGYTLGERTGADQPFSYEKTTAKGKGKGKEKPKSAAEAEHWKARAKDVRAAQANDPSAGGVPRSWFRR